MQFLLSAKGSHENTSFDTFKCSDENLPNSSCHFPNHKSVFLQILHDSSMSWNTLLCIFLGQNTLHKRNQSANFLEFLVLRSKFTKFLSFLKQKISSLQIFHNFGEISPEQSKAWNFALWWTPFQIKFQLKKYRRLLSHGTEEWCKV